MKLKVLSNEEKEVQKEGEKKLIQSFRSRPEQIWVSGARFILFIWQICHHKSLSITHSDTHSTSRAQTLTLSLRPVFNVSMPPLILFHESLWVDFAFWGSSLPWNVFRCMVRRMAFFQRDQPYIKVRSNPFKYNILGVNFPIFWNSCQRFQLPGKALTQSSRRYFWFLDNFSDCWFDFSAVSVERITLSSIVYVALHMLNFFCLIGKLRR